MTPDDRYDWLMYRHERGLWIIWSIHYVVVQIFRWGTNVRWRLLRSFELKVYSNKNITAKGGNGETMQFNSIDMYSSQYSLSPNSLGCTDPINMMTVFKSNKQELKYRGITIYASIMSKQNQNRRDATESKACKKIRIREFEISYTTMATMKKMYPLSRTGVKMVEQRQTNDRKSVMTHSSRKITRSKTNSKK